MNQSPFSPKESLALLAGVSRSFYLTVKVLPHSLREPVCVAYLLARASDTIADSSDLPAERRAGHLHTYAEMVAGNFDPGVLEVIRKEVHPVDPFEKQLIGALDRCFASLAKLKA